MTIAGTGFTVSLDLATGVRRYEESADRAVRAVTTTDGADAPEAIVELLGAQRALEASLAVARAHDRLLGNVIDILA